VNGDKFLQTSRSTKAQHRPFSSLERKMRVLASIVLPTPCFLFLNIPDNLHRSAVGSQLVRNDDFWRTVSFHCFPQEFEGCLAIATFCYIRFQHLTFVINSAPQVVYPTIYLHNNPVQVPLPVRILPKLLNTSLADFHSEHRKKSIPPKPDGFVTVINTTFMQQILHVSKRQRKSNIHHHGQADDL
jgi:hypothetical protein